MHPALPALTRPDHPAIIMGSGKKLTFAELDRRSNRVCHLLRAQGLRRGDTIALLVGNHLEFFDICCAAMRMGLFYTPIATGLTASEIAYILKDCGAGVFFADHAYEETVSASAAMLPDLKLKYSVRGPIADFEPLDEAVRGYPESRISDEALGQNLLYSSGTTGKPKGIRLPLPERAIDAQDDSAALYYKEFGLTADSVYLSPAPLYHAAPLRFAIGILSIGATVVAMEKFDPEKALSLIEQHNVTHSQWVPTMFIKLLGLPAEIRAKYRLDTHRVAIHGAAPCPVDTKLAMIDWWGPILYEYYGGTEGIGSCTITSEEWLEHQGSVGRSKVGQVHIFDENGNELGARETGFVYFSGGPSFEYLNRQADTAAVANAKGARTYGDVGHVDEDGYLYLTDRASNLIISGGVNIYPQETENILLTHPRVADAAVFGVPNPEFGEEVKAVIQPLDWDDVGDAFVDELIEHCRKSLAAVKCPRSIDFDRKLPREDNGKLYKRLLREKYWTGKQSRLV